MKKYIILSIATAALFINSCSSGQSQNNKTTLTPIEFAEKLKQLPTAILLDVRTPDEFLGGHITNAKNIDWNGDDFDKQISTLDKSKTVLVYCKSGRRSAAAASKMRSEGFKEVIELHGGIMKWVDEKMPLVNN